MEMEPEDVEWLKVKIDLPFSLLPVLCPSFFPFLPSLISSAPSLPFSTLACLPFPHLHVLLDPSLLPFALFL